MSKGRKKSGSESNSDARRRSPKRSTARLRSPGWYEGKRPVLRFVLLFGVFMAVFYALTITPWAENRLWPWYLEWNAQASGMLLNLLGQETTVAERAISSPRAALLIERGCDAIHPSGLFIAAVLASPVALWTKLSGMLLGTLALMATNLVRIVSLFFVQIHFRSAFEFIHVEVWQALFIFLSVLLWALWARWAMRRSADQTDAAS